MGTGPLRIQRLTVASFAATWRRFLVSYVGRRFRFSHRQPHVNIPYRVVSYRILNVTYKAVD